MLITEDLKGANELSFGHRYRIVTLEGDVVNPGGSMTGGAVKKKILCSAEAASLRR